MPVVMAGEGEDVDQGNIIKIFDCKIFYGIKILL